MPGMGALHPAMQVSGVAGASTRADGSHRVYLEVDSEDVRAKVREILGNHNQIDFIVGGKFRAQEQT